MSRALPAAAEPAASTSRMRATRSRVASACAIAPPSSPAPRTATVVIGSKYSTEMLNGKVALVTGGSRGIGLSIAQALLQEGASVVITGTDQERLKAARAELGARATAVRADVRDYGEVETAI